MNSIQIVCFRSDIYILSGSVYIVGFSGMGLIYVTKICRKGAIYLPKHVMEMLKIKEGNKVLMKIYDDKIVLEFIPDPLALALKVKKWAKTTVEEFERESENEQYELYSH